MKSITKKIYVTEDGVEFGDKQSALNHEENYIKSKTSNEFLKLFPSEHPSDTNFELHCVKCGIALIEYEKIFDGHRNERGSVVLERPIYRIFEGRYCFNCYMKLDRELKLFLVNFWEKRYSL